MQSTNRDAALALVRAGLHIFACRADKTPLIAGWEAAASSSPFQIGIWWDTNPEAMPAIPVGAHGLVVIDCDRKGGIDGVANFQTFCAEHRIDLSDHAFAVETPSKGVHYYFHSDTAFGNSRGSLPDGIDVRGVGGYVIAPGSALPDGRSYRHLAGTWDAIPPLPERLAAFLKSKRPATAPEPSVNRPEPTEREREYAERALGDECEALAAKQPGQGRNGALNRAAHSIGTMVGAGWLERETAEQALWEAAERNGYRAKDGDPEAWNTLQSGLESGITKPRDPLPRIDVPQWVREMVAGWLTAHKAKQNDAVTAQPSKRSVTLLFGTEIQEQAISWLWDQYLPMGSLILIAGAGGVGKSTITCDIAARITNGANWPDGTPCRKPGRVLIWSSEDDAARVIKPRLMVAGADPRSYAVITRTTDAKGESRAFDPANDIELLRSAVDQIGGISLLVIDPIVSAITGDVNKVNEVRRNLQSIVDFASTTGCAVLGITHFAKGTAGRNASERVIGSTAFKDLSRVTLAVAKDPETGEHVITRAKSNYSSEGGGFSFAVEVIRISDDITASRVQWGRELKGSSRAILAEVEGDEKQDGDKMRVAKQFLIEVLRTGPVPSRDVLKQAREGFGITEDTLRRAYKDIGMKPTRIGFGASGQWMWALPVANPSQSSR